MYFYLDNNDFENFQKIFCTIVFKGLDANSEGNQKILDSILNNLEKIKNEYCIEKKDSNDQ